MTFENTKAVWAKIEPYMTSLLGMVKVCLAWAWTAVRTLLKPFWVPAVTLARNPLTAVMVGVMLIVACVLGDFVRSLKDQNMVRDEKASAARVIAANNVEHARMLIAAKAQAADELGVLQKQVNDFEAKMKAAGVAVPEAAKPARKPVAKAVTKAVAVTKPWWQF